MIKIMTIRREFGSGGRTIGKEVAEKLHYKYFAEQEWGERQNYHLSIDNGFLGIEKLLH